ncbi:hypothetical protein RND81_03G231200 [Saponaria officinalis]|uniref:NAC domain-containing protein n=1 Tax=Saponaria officinalis TaxID=3572 RepID=A0AAW1M6X6_SAPOF
MDSNESCVPPGFRFHPTEEELVGYYLKRKIDSLNFELDVIVDLDLYRMEPWDMQDKCRLSYSGQNEWYFFSHKDRKYPTGSRTNRATAAGFWKATGRDKAISSNNLIIGMRKTLVYYKGRAPNGRKSDWIMHEYRLQTSEYEPIQEEGWVVCRAFKKPSPNHKQGFDAWQHHYNNYYNMRNNNNNNNNIINSTSSLLDLPSPTQATIGQNLQHPHQLLGQPSYIFEQECTSNCSNLIEMPRLDDSPLSTSFVAFEEHDLESSFGCQWEALDNLLSSQIPEAQDQLNSFFGCFPDL